MIRYWLLVGLVLLAAPAHAEDLPSWSVDGGPVWVLLGGKNSTGDVGASVTGRYHLQVTDSISLHPGLGATAFGLMGPSRWWGVLAGPEAGASWRGEHWSVGGAVGIDYGRAPTCNDWGLCLRYWGWYPRITAAVGYEMRPFGAAAGVTARYVDTMGWTGVSWQPELRARLSF